MSATYTRHRRIVVRLSIFSTLMALCILHLLTLPAPAGANQVRIVMTEWTPYTSASLPHNGALAEVTDAAFRRAGITPDFICVPWIRALRIMQRDEADALLAVYRSQKNAESYYLSESLLAVDSVFVRLSSLDIPYTRLEDLAGWRIGIVRNTSYAESLAQVGLMQVEEAPHELMNYRKLISGRVDMILDTRETTERMIANMPQQERHNIVYMEPPYITQTLHMAFARNAHGLQWKTAFDAGLQALKKSGEYATILERHHIARSTGTPAIRGE